MSPDNITMSGLFGDPDYQQRLNEAVRKGDALYEGDGKHFIVAWIGDSGMETNLVCEWPEDDRSAPCYANDEIGCKIKYSWENIGTDMLERQEDAAKLLKVKFPIGYRTEGHGEDFEDWIFSVRPKP